MLLCVKVSFAFMGQDIWIQSLILTPMKTATLILISSMFLVGAAGSGREISMEPVLATGGAVRPVDQTRENTRVPLVPPKPNELDSTTSTFASRAVCGT